MDMMYESIEEREIRKSSVRFLLNLLPILLRERERETD